MKRVFVNGYGSIGNRIASFLRDDPEITLVGVGKHTPDERINTIKSSGIDVYIPEKTKDDFAQYDIAGTIESALDSCDLVIDASPGGCGHKNKKSLYEPRGIRAIYQGGESVRGPDAVSDVLFNSESNYDTVAGKSHVMQGSCNVTGMGRILEPLRAAFGDRLSRFDVTLVRRWADIEQKDKQLVDTIEMTENPHHGEDAKAYLGADTPLYVRAVKVPTRQMHLHILDVRFSGKMPDIPEVHAIYGNSPGVAVLWTAAGTRDVREFARTMEFHFTDTNMIHIHANMTVSTGDTIQMMYSDDQTGIVIPENHMLMQAMLFEREYKEARAHTESVFGMAVKKQKLQEHFAKS
ncbi:MAG: type II glyceraldehyde-3-phosphate dehydrogenase [Nitrosopumilus sp. H8]|nr:MAG: type II glyceraldehyde-3-phosphate dehydrogenase [Nitrosopumilus sp. H8]